MTPRRRPGIWLRQILAAALRRVQDWLAQAIAWLDPTETVTDATAETVAAVRAPTGTEVLAAEAPPAHWLAHIRRHGGARFVEANAPGHGAETTERAERSDMQEDAAPAHWRRDVERARARVRFRAATGWRAWSVRVEQAVMLAPSQARAWLRTVWQWMLRGVEFATRKMRTRTNHTMPISPALDHDPIDRSTRESHPDRDPMGRFAVVSPKEQSLVDESPKTSRESEHIAATHGVAVRGDGTPTHGVADRGDDRRVQQNPMRNVVGRATSEAHPDRDPMGRFAIASSKEQVLVDNSQETSRKNEHIAATHGVAIRGDGTPTHGVADRGDDRRVQQHPVCDVVGRATSEAHPDRDPMGRFAVASSKEQSLVDNSPETSRKSEHIAATHGVAIRGDGTPTHGVADRGDDMATHGVAVRGDSTDNHRVALREDDEHSVPNRDTGNHLDTDVEHTNEQAREDSTSSDVMPEVPITTLRDESRMSVGENEAARNQHDDAEHTIPGSADFSLRTMSLAQTDVCAPSDNASGIITEDVATRWNEATAEPSVVVTTSNGRAESASRRVERAPRTNSVWQRLARWLQTWSFLPRRIPSFSASTETTAPPSLSRRTVESGTVLDHALPSDAGAQMRQSPRIIAEKDAESARALSAQRERHSPGRMRDGSHQNLSIAAMQRDMSADRDPVGRRDDETPADADDVSMARNVLVDRDPMGRLGTEASITADNMATHGVAVRGDNTAIKGVTVRENNPATQITADNMATHGVAVRGDNTAIKGVPARGDDGRRASRRTHADHVTIEHESETAPWRESSDVTPESALTLPRAKNVPGSVDASLRTRSQTQIQVCVSRNTDAADTAFPHGNAPAISSVIPASQQTQRTITDTPSAPIVPHNASPDQWPALDSDDASATQTACDQSQMLSPAVSIDSTASFRTTGTSAAPIATTSINSAGRSSRETAARVQHQRGHEMFPTIPESMPNHAVGSIDAGSSSPSRASVISSHHQQPPIPGLVITASAWPELPDEIDNHATPLHEADSTPDATAHLARWQEGWSWSA